MIFFEFSLTMLFIFSIYIDYILYVQFFYNFLRRWFGLPYLQFSLSIVFSIYIFVVNSFIYLQFSLAVVFITKKCFFIVDFFIYSFPCPLFSLSTSFSVIFFMLFSYVQLYLSIFFYFFNFFSMDFFIFNFCVNDWLYQKCFLLIVSFIYYFLYQFFFNLQFLIDSFSLSMVFFIYFFFDDYFQRFFLYLHNCCSIVFFNQFSNFPGRLFSKALIFLYRWFSFSATNDFLSFSFLVAFSSYLLCRQFF